MVDQDDRAVASIGVRSTLTQRDWLIAGQKLMREGGVRAVKLSTLTDALSVTSGSFYHHFRNMEQYLDALAAFYGDAQPTEGLGLLDGRPPLARLQGLIELEEQQDMRRLDRAMRTWASEDPRAAAAVRSADARLLMFLEAAFRELGFDREQARARTYLMFAAGAANVYPPWPVSEAAQARMFELLVTPPAATGR